MDLATIFGIILGSIFLVMGCAFDFNAMALNINNLLAFYDKPSIFIVIGGSLGGSMLMGQNFQTWVTSAKGAVQVFKLDTVNPKELINQLVTYAETARRDGILALENVTEEIKDDYLVRGIRLAVDGTDPELIQGIMETELEIMGERHNTVINFWNMLGYFAPCWGMLGTLIGLVLMLKDMRPETIGPMMAIALITTFYGAIVANFIALPMAAKMKSKHGDEIIRKSIILKGVMSIQSGDNPRIVQQKLMVYLPPKDRNFEK